MLIRGLNIEVVDGKWKIMDEQSTVLLYTDSRIIG